MPADTGGWDYVAIEPISYEGVRAYNIGDLVHADNVAAYGYLEENLVAKRDTKAAKAVTETPPATATPASSTTPQA